MSSPYPLLDNKPIDQLKVTELKDELRRRKLMTKGLKDDLIRRLDEALRAEKNAEEVCEVDTDKEEYATPVGKGSETEEGVLNESSVEKEQQDGNNGMETGDSEKVVLQESDSVKDGEVVQKEADCAMEEAKTQVGSENVESMETETPMLLDAKLDDESGDRTMENGVLVADVNGTPAKLDAENNVEGESSVTVDTVEVVTQTTEITTEVAGSVEINVESTSTVTVTSNSVELQNNEFKAEEDSMSPREDAVLNEITTEVAGSVEINVESTSTVTVTSNSVELQNNEFKAEEDSMSPREDAVLNDSSQNNQVPEVSPSLGFQVKSDSISTDSVSINEKNELKDNLNADNFHIDLDNVKPEMVQPSSSDVPHNGGDIAPLDDQEPCENQVPIEELDNVNATNEDLSKKNDIVDGGSSEKLNLDRSSGDDSMEEDVLESKQVESNHVDEVEDRSEETKDHVMKEASPVGGIGAGFSPSVKNVSTENSSATVPAEKRKLEDQSTGRNNEPPKRRRWNTETLKVPDPQSSSLSPSTTPKDAFQPKFAKRNFNRSDSTLSGGDTPKERVVPPSPKSPTTSLKIDRFLRPFTLKAVQELLGKTGTVSSFWMDHIKTHCYVTFSKVEEAIETRNALYNLQWPPNGGKLLVADFVDPQEVKQRVEAPPTPSGPLVKVALPPPPTPSQPQPSPRLTKTLPATLPPPPTALPPPPPPPTDPQIVRERLPPPPPLVTPLVKKPDPPIVTLDDLFRKTRATPRIYYLPLSEEQVAAKLAMQQDKQNPK
ncbi:hypothetical protein ACHQM5_022380 [Ranunculus cassubicifolius]